MLVVHGFDSLIEMDLIPHILQLNGILQGLLVQTKPPRIIAQYLSPLTILLILTTDSFKQRMIEQPFHWILFRFGSKLDFGEAARTVNDQQPRAWRQGVRKRHEECCGFGD